MGTNTWPESLSKFIEKHYFYVTEVGDKYYTCKCSTPFCLTAFRHVYNSVKSRGGVVVVCALFDPTKNRGKKRKNKSTKK